MSQKYTIVVSVFEPNKTDFVWTVDASSELAAEQAAISMTTTEIEAGVTLDPEAVGYVIQDCIPHTELEESYNNYNQSTTYTSYSSFVDGTSSTSQADVSITYTPYSDSESGLKEYASYISMANVSSTLDN